MVQEYARTQVLSLYNFTYAEKQALSEFSVYNFS